MTSDNTDEIVASLKDEIEALCRYLLGEPNRHLSSAHNWRYGNKGALSIEVGPGAKCGLWKSHEDDAGGGPIQLIRHVNSCSVAEAFAFAKSFLGMEGTRPAPRPRPEPKPAPAPDASRTAHAKAVWAGTVPLSGTIGATYLVEFRGVPSESIAALEPLVRFHPTYRASPDARVSHAALIALATDSDDNASAIQAVRLQGDGRKFAGPVPKVSNGILAGAAVRLPGVGDLILIEGPEKGIVAWAATARPVWVSLGSLSKIAAQVRDGASVTLSRDQDKPGSQAAKAFEATCDALTARGCVVSVACPPMAAGGAKVDWDDVARRDGIAAVSRCFAAASLWVRTGAEHHGLPPYYPAATEDREAALARQRNLIMGTIEAESFIAAARREVRETADSLHSDEMSPAEKGAITKRVQREVMNRLGIPQIRDGKRVLITGSQGSGKSRAACEGVAAITAPMVLKWGVPTIEKAEEQAAEYGKCRNEGSLPGYVYLGRGAPDPESYDDRGYKTMCRRHRTASRAAKNGIEVRKVICNKCDHKEGCGSQRQDRELAALAGRVVIFMASKLLFLPSRHSADLIIADESLKNQATGETVEFHPDLLTSPQQWRLSGDLDKALEVSGTLSRIHSAIKSGKPLLKALREARDASGTLNPVDSDQLVSAICWFDNLIAGTVSRHHVNCRRSQSSVAMIAIIGGPCSH